MLTTRKNEGIQGRVAKRYSKNLSRFYAYDDDDDDDNLNNNNK